MLTEAKEPTAVIHLKRWHYLIYMFVFYSGCLVVHMAQLLWEWTSWLELLYIVPVFCVLLIVKGPEIRYRQTYYTIHPVMIEVIRGLYVRKRTVVPIDRIQSVKLSQGPIARKYGLVKVTIVTSGDEYHLPYVSEHQADVLKHGITNRIKEVLTYV